MGKAALTKAGAAATQSLARELLPFIDERFNSLQGQVAQLHDHTQRQIAQLQDQTQRQTAQLQDQIRVLEGSISSLRDDVVDRYERQLNLINEVNSRIVRLEGKMEGYMEAMRLVIHPQKPKRRVG